MSKKKLLSLIFLTIFPFTCGFMNIAHRGDNQQGIYAEHSYISYDRAVSAQVDYLELDLQETADHQLVLSHDDNLSRIFGVDRKIEDYSYDQLKDYLNQSNESIHRLEDVFNRYQNNTQVKYMIEPKAGNKLAAKQLIKLIKKYKLQKRVLLESFSKETLAELKNLAPEIPRVQLAGNYEELATSKDYASSIYSSRIAKYLARKGDDYLLWGVNSKKQMEKFLNPDKGVTGILTDHPVRLADLLHKHDIFKLDYNFYQFPIEKLVADVQLKNGNFLAADKMKLTDNQLSYFVKPGLWIKQDQLRLSNSTAPRAKTGLIKLNHETAIYPDLTFKHPTGKILRADSQWNYYGIAIINGKTVYNLGGAQWIK
ncbi:MAG: glycerophosphodiester phosphodiesterase [Lactobacillus sp.]|nr:glycerophosphodiester phosphodiesterase [Lactobacillus sp.]